MVNEPAYEHPSVRAPGVSDGCRHRFEWRMNWPNVGYLFVSTGVRSVWLRHDLQTFSRPLNPPVLLCYKTTSSYRIVLGAESRAGRARTTLCGPIESLAKAGRACRLVASAEELFGTTRCSARTATGCCIRRWPSSSSRSAKPKRMF
jgi:hypothetical protein